MKRPVCIVLAVVCSGAVLLVFPVAAMAEDRLPVLVEGCAAPCAGYEVSAEVQNDWVFAADPSLLKSDELEPTITVDLFLAPTDNLRFATSIITEHVIEREAGENQIFHGVGSYLAELYTSAEAGPATIRAGKFDTIFSLASEVAPGINATELLSDIDADERLGAEVVLDFAGLGIKQALAATAFTTDRSFLSNSLFTRRGRTRLSDGGAGNTDGLSSFSITLDGCRGAEPVACYSDGDFGYRFGMRYQAAGQPSREEPEDRLKGGDELAYLAAATTSVELDEMTLRLLGETTYLRHFDGGSDDAWLLTGSAALELEPVTYVASYTQQLNLVAGEPDTREHLADFEAIYEPQEGTSFEGWEFAAAYTVARDADETAHIFSVRAVFNFDGDVELGAQ
ncbi:hypothetical protein AU381_04870 [Sinorhizobium glycinis]|uniref:Porin n=1 Tax=Sinorhizobium glycinis TaxID=1472378 RepID=A0A178Y0X4_9HYPH|nr:hypothetical protein [Sinorhizobium glycinis]OAP41210.1 hypothetical protein AU381_04870 [Sinorhizobium glycinis]